MGDGVGGELRPSTFSSESISIFNVVFSDFHTFAVVYILSQMYSDVFDHDLWFYA